jgi:hypothetical protein
MRVELERLSLDPKNKEELEIQMERDSVDYGNSSIYTIWSPVLFAAGFFCRRDY